MLDDACRALVFARDGHRCLKTGSTEHLQWAHVYSRRYKTVRWDPDNSMCLSAGSHLWWHHRPVDSALWWVEMVGEPFKERLREKMLLGGKIVRRATLLWLQLGLERFRRNE